MMKYQTRGHVVCVATLLMLTGMSSGCFKDRQKFEGLLVLEDAPRDMTIVAGKKVALVARAKTNTHEDIKYVWEKLDGDATNDVSQTASLAFTPASPAGCMPKVDAYRLVTSAGALRKEKTFSLTTLCSVTGTKPTGSDEIQIAPGEEIWLAPGEAITLTATTPSTNATLKWEQVSPDASRTHLSDDAQYTYTAPMLHDVCETREVFLTVVATGNNAEQTKTMSVHVQNPKCVLQGAYAPVSNDTTRILVASDDSVYIGTKNGLTRYKSGKITNFKTAGGNVPLEIVTALAEVVNPLSKGNSEILVCKARKFPLYPVRGFGIDTLQWANNIPVWKDRAILEDSYVSSIYLDQSGAVQIISANNYQVKGGVRVARNSTFDASSELLSSQSLYAVLNLGKQTLFGGDNGILVFEDNYQLAYFDGSTWNGNRGLFGYGSNRYVRALARDAAGVIWIGLQSGMLESGGLVQYQASPDNVMFGTWSNVVPLPAGNDVRALAVDASNRLWIATNSGLTLRNNDGSFKVFGTADGLPSNDIRDVTYDAESQDLWIATSAGAARWSLALLKL